MNTQSRRNKDFYFYLENKYGIIYLILANIKKANMTKK